MKERIAANDDGALGELEAIERWLKEGVRGDEIELLERYTAPRQTSPDFRVRGELVEVKTRNIALSKRYISDQILAANNQIKSSGLAAGQRGAIEIQLKGEAARTAPLRDVELQVDKAFERGENSSVRRVAVYGNGHLIGEWVRTVANAIVRIFPPG